RGNPKALSSVIRRRMTILTTIAWIFVVVYIVIVVLLYAFQTKLIFFPGRLPADYVFERVPPAREIWLKTADGERIHALFYPRDTSRVILYFHGNAGDLSGWQFVAQDFAGLPYSMLIVDYRGYGKSSGTISEKGMYLDADAAYGWLVKNGFR